MICIKRQHFVLIRRFATKILGDERKTLPIIVSTSAVPIHLFTREIEVEALKQLVVLAESGIVKGFVAAMADVHVGETKNFFIDLSNFERKKAKVLERRLELFLLRRPTSVRMPLAPISVVE